jgi:lysophospholipase L1-like esterase
VLAGAALAAALAATAMTAAAGTSSAGTFSAGTSSAGTASAGTSAAGVAPAVRYVALGDSYSSGTGAGDNDPASGSCKRSADAYPEQWAGRHSPAAFKSVACSGATTSDVLSSQVSALSPRSTLVSLTIGGNDAGFTHVMEVCVLESDRSCLSAISAAESFIATGLPARLNATLRAIRARARSARIVLLGYPRLYDLSTSSKCVGLATAKRTALNRGADKLDGALSAAAARNGDVFADVRGQFAGHEICDGGSWLHAVTIPIGWSYHPTANGQDLGYLPVFSAAAGSQGRRP